MNKHNFLKIEEFYPLSLEEDIININNVEEFFPISINKNEPFFVIFMIKKKI